MGLALMPITICLCIEHFDDHLSSKNNGLLSLSDYNEDVNWVYLYNYHTWKLSYYHIFENDVSFHNCRNLV